MGTKLVGVCKMCSYASSNIYGEKCSKATYRDHGGGYGESWVSNDCTHDQNQVKLVSLFKPVGDDSKLNLENMVIELRGKILELESQNTRLRSLIK